MKPITTRIKESRSGASYPMNQEVTMNADGSGGPIDACGCGSPNKFKAHKMYSKSGGEVMANTNKEHLALKKEGFGHSPTKLRKAKSSRPSNRADYQLRKSYQESRQERRGSGNYLPKVKKENSPVTLKDACYKKVAARYSGGNSAYRSGAMAKCRKVGVANWGNSKK